MEDPKSLSSVAEFHRLFNHPILPEPKIPSANRCQLRVALLREELSELETAIANDDLIGIADALCDLQYVLSGAILEFGLGEKFKNLFDEVQRSNMSKACSSEQEAEASLEYYRNKGVDCYAEQKGDVFLLYRKEDKKTLKSRFYSEADLESILNQKP
jgi:predicted HAD superfamily Cof-like phosphohydrolase